MKSEDLMKYASIAFLLVVGITTIFVGVWDIIHNIALPDYVKLVVSSGITYSLTSLSLNHGSSLALKGVNNGNGEILQQTNS